MLQEISHISKNCFH